LYFIAVTVLWPLPIEDKHNSTDFKFICKYGHRQVTYTQFNIVTHIRNLTDVPSVQGKGIS